MKNVSPEDQQKELRHLKRRVRMLEKIEIDYEKAINKLTHYSSLLQDTNDALIIQDFKGKIIAWDRGAASMYGWTEDEALQKNILSFVNTKDHETYRKIFDSGQKGEFSKDIIECQKQHKSGKLLDIWLTYTLLNDESGSPYAFATTERDITARKEAARKLYESERRYRNLVESMGEGVLVFSKDYSITLANPTSEKILDADIETLKNINLKEFFDTENLALIKNKLDSLNLDNKVTFEARITSLKGEKRTIITTITQNLDSEKRFTGWLAIIRDMTRIRQMEEDIIKADKMESIGLMASGISHDFNNILSIILGNASILKMKIDKSNGTLMQKVDRIETAADRARDLTKQLMSFAKGNTPDKKPLNLDDLIHECVNLAGSGKHLNTTYDIDENLWEVLADPGQISQVLNNLIINASHAMPGGGNFYVTAQNIAMAEDNIYALETGNYVKTTVRDEGTGISPENLKKIFDPYFTTKKTGNGLGLATSFRILKKHGGQISAESELKKGTTFTLFLPKHEVSPDQPDLNQRDAEFATQISRIHQKRQHRVLLIDGDSGHAEIAKIMLQKAGCQVEISNNVMKAMEMFTQSVKPFKIIAVCKSVFASSLDEEKIKRFISLAGNVKSILIMQQEDTSENNGFDAFITKPYQFAEIKTVIDNFDSPAN